MQATDAFRGRRSAGWPGLGEEANVPSPRLADTIGPSTRLVFEGVAR